MDLSKHVATSVLWPRRGDKFGGPGLCGLAGHGYVFLRLAKSDPPNLDKWYSYAESCAESAFNNFDVLLKFSKRPNSLFNGAGGLAMLLLALAAEDRNRGPLPISLKSRNEIRSSEAPPKDVKVVDAEAVHVSKAQLLPLKTYRYKKLCPLLTSGQLSLPITHLIVKKATG